MKKQILFLYTIFFLNYGYSQTSNKGVVYYNYVANNYNVSYNSYLVFNQNTSYFVTAKDSLGVSGQKVNTINNKDVVEAVDFEDVKKTRKEGLQVFFNRETDSIYFTNAFSLVSKLIYAKEKRPQLIWAFTSETKKIGKFICKKATTKFRGRDYVCWYTQQIPLPYGPWKLQGLPGLILEATSKDGFFKIIFKKIKYPVKNIKLPLKYQDILKKETVFIPLKKYKKKQKEYVKRKDNSLKVMAKKYNVEADPFSQKLNFLEIFEF